MPGWDSLETVTRLHGGAQIASLVLLALVIALASFAAWQLRGGIWPQWLDVGEYQIGTRFFEIGSAVVLALLLVVQIMTYGYGLRRDTLAVAAAQAGADRLRRLTEAQARPPADNPGRYLKENSDLRQKLVEAEDKLAEHERAQARKRLSQDQIRFLVEALRPFAGQKVSIAAIRGDDDGELLARDFVSAFDAAGWDHDAKSGIPAQQWDRDPIGIEVTLNEADARASQISSGIGALINAVRQLGLVYDNTIYMSSEVQAGQAQLKVGKKLRN